MNIREQLNEILATLGLPKLTFDRNGCARMLFEGKVVVNFECDEISGQLHLYCDLGSLPSVGVETLYRTLLEANLFGVQTRGATLALDGSQNQVVLSKTLPLGTLELSSFSQLLEGLVESAAYWQQFLAEKTPGNTPGTQAPPAPLIVIAQGPATGPGASRRRSSIARK